MGIISLVEERKGAGRPWKLLPKSAPLSAHKLRELMEYLGKPDRPHISDEEVAIKLGLGQKSHDLVAKWRTKEPLPEYGQKLIALEYDVPLRWWNQKGVPIQNVIGRGLGKDEGDQADGPPVAPKIEVPFIEEGKLRADPNAGYEMHIDNVTLRYSRIVPICREFLKKPGQHFLIQIENDSMEPRYCHGDVVLVHLQQQDPHDLIGEPVAAWVPEKGGGIIKLLKDGKEMWVLHSVNDMYDDLLVPKTQPHFHAFEVVAVVFQRVKEPPKKKAA